MKRRYKKLLSMMLVAVIAVMPWARQSSRVPLFRMLMRKQLLSYIATMMLAGTLRRQRI